MCTTQPSYFSFVLYCKTLKNLVKFDSSLWKHGAWVELPKMVQDAVKLFQSFIEPFYQLLDPQGQTNKALITFLLTKNFSILTIRFLCYISIIIFIIVGVIIHIISLNVYTLLFFWIGLNPSLPFNWSTWYTIFSKNL